jgi:hypothetical protein
VVHFAMMRRTEAHYSRHGAHHRFAAPDRPCSNMRFASSSSR